MASFRLSVMNACMDTHTHTPSSDVSLDVEQGGPYFAPINGSDVSLDFLPDLRPREWMSQEKATEQN